MNAHSHRFVEQTGHPVTRYELSAILTPFVNARFNLQRNAKGYVIPRSTLVDIHAVGLCVRDADIRGLDDRGIERCFMGGFADLIAWEDVLSVTLRGEDGSEVEHRLVGDFYLGLVRDEAAEWRAFS